MIHAFVEKKFHPVFVLVMVGVVSIWGACKKPQEILDDYSKVDYKTFVKGDTVMPFRYLHPEMGDWKVEIRISGDDLHDLSHKMTSRKFTATDAEILNRIRRLKFLYGVGRPHKASSTLRVYDHITLQEQHGIIFEKNYLAIESSAYGIMACVDEEEFFAILAEMD